MITNKEEELQSYKNFITDMMNELGCSTVEELKNGAKEILHAIRFVYGNEV